jgi:cellulose synthase/poly-beta-1,6-N-acetylglucosamine synthase-like glycosyltransferase
MPQATKRSTFLKVVIVFAVGFMLGVGLCGLDYLLASKGIGKSTEEFGVGPLDGVSLVVMFFSALGLALTLIAWVVAAIVKSFTTKSADRGPTRPFNKKDEDS